MDILRKITSFAGRWANVPSSVQETHSISHALRASTDSIQKTQIHLSDEAKLMMGQLAARLPAAASLRDAGFKVFSQNGEDGIIQHIIREVAPKTRTFIEFGVQDYTESNTRFLLLNNNWRGLVIDPAEVYVDRIKASPECRYKCDLTARRAFLTRDNINDVFREEGFSGEIGLLSIDVDGMDWHLWNAVTVVDPAIVVVEYNRNLPVDRPIVVPYQEEFDRLSGNHCYYGASLPALRHLGRQKGYRFVGTECHRTNAFFVKEDLAGNSLPEAHITADDRSPGRRTRYSAICLFSIS